MFSTKPPWSHRSYIDKFKRHLSFLPRLDFPVRRGADGSGGAVRMNDGMNDLIHQWLDGAIDSDGDEKLNVWLKAAPENMQQFVEANVREQLLRDAANSVLLADEIQDRVSLSADSSRRPKRLILAVATTIAASLLISIGWLWWPVETSQPPFLSVAAAHDTDGQLKVGDRIGAQTIQFESGFVRLLFDDGVEVTLQGPAAYELIGLGQTRLLSGILTATVPPGAEGFEVKTPAAEVIDLGTAFGIELDEKGTARISVFDGEVEVTPMNKEETRLVQEGETIRVTSASEIESTEFDTQTFEKLWPTASGIAGSTGAFQFAPPWPRPMGLVQSDSSIFVLPEGYAKTLLAPLAVNITTAGEFRDVDDLTGGLVPEGTRVKSFLLQFRPTGENIGPPERRPALKDLKRIVGEITFDRPILGLVVQGNDLRATDGLFSMRGGQVPQKGRALELFGTPRDDVITLSDDLCTVKLDLAAFSIFADQVRVIVNHSISK